jgi:hypothetical protein
MNLAPCMRAGTFLLLGGLVLGFGLVPIASSGQETTLEQILSKEEQASLGLSSMPQEKRAALTKVLTRIFRQGVAFGEAKGATGGGGGGSATETQVDGEFNGWEGETIIKLLNGQIWQQTEYHYEYHYAYMPKVLLYSTGAVFKMKVKGTSQAIGVQRLR